MADEEVEISDNQSSIDNTQIDYTNIFTFANVIKMPIEAVIGANIQAAQSALGFIKNFGFEKGDDPKNPNKLGKPKMLTFTYIYNNGGIEQRMVISIPLLSLVTIPLLTIRNAKFDIGINVLNEITVKDNSSNDEMESLSIQDILVLLGPAEKGKLQEIGNSESIYSYSSSVETNMQATLEVESSDLPSGIIKMINMFQDAATGKGNDIYKLNYTGKDFITFSKSNTKESILITLAKNKNPIQGEILKVNVVPETSKDPDLVFKNPIRIQKGYVVGTPTKTEAEVLTDEEGKIKVQFHISDEVSSSENGFISINTSKANKILIYYSIDPTT